MQIALLQIDPTPGDFEGNVSLLVRAAQRARDLGADLAVSPELSILGYPPRDLLARSDLPALCETALTSLAKQIDEQLPLLVGCITRNPLPWGPSLHNSAALIHQGTVGPYFHKKLLPTYDVFDEARYFQPGQDQPVLTLNGTRIGVTICEDIWNQSLSWIERRYDSDPVGSLTAQGVDLLLNLSASPYSVGRPAQRELLLSEVARRAGCPVLLVNQVGANDDIVFDGSSCAFDRNGLRLARARSFAPDLLLVDTSAPPDSARQPPAVAEEEEIWSALVLGIRDYFAKNRASQAVVGLSGGIDSAVVAALAADALGPRSVRGVSMPSHYSSEGSRTDAQELAENLGLQFETVPIGPLQEVFTRSLQPSLGAEPWGTTEENLQARVRGTILMAVSNRTGALLLSTGNKSEMAVGYCTLYGDMNGALGVLADVFKTDVYRLARWRNRRHRVIPENSLLKPPSAELRPDQCDQDSLPPYEVLDRILALHLEQGMGFDELVAQGEDAAVVAPILTLVRKAEFKRRQAPPGLRISRRAFGTGWRMPVARGVFVEEKAQETVSS